MTLTARIVDAAERARVAAAADSWFCIDGANYNIDGWAANSGEVDASVVNVTVEPRNLDSYAQELGLGTTLADFAEQARMQSRHNHRSELTATAAGNYIRAGYL